MAELPRITEVVRTPHAIYEMKAGSRATHSWSPAFTECEAEFWLCVGDLHGREWACGGVWVKEQWGA